MLSESLVALKSCLLLPPLRLPKGLFALKCLSVYFGDVYLHCLSAELVCGHQTVLDLPNTVVGQALVPLGGLRVVLK